jgi:hypothetical protein
MSSARSNQSGAGAWFGGLVVGAASVLLLTELPAAGVVIAVAFAVPALASARRLPGIAGLLVGLPATWLAVIGLATARCAAFDPQPGSECGMGDVSGLAVMAAALLVVGLALSAAAARRR